MSIAKLDYFFPFLVFFYGVLAILVIEVLSRLPNIKSSQQLSNQIYAKRNFAFICLIIGGLWSLQNIWF